MQHQKQIVILFILFLNKIEQIHMQGLSIASPCPEIFRYGFDGIEWFGIVTIRDPSPGQPLVLKVVLLVHGKPSTNYLGEIQVLTRGQYISDAPVEYKIKFPKTLFPPKLQRIRVNKKLVCYATAEPSLFMTQIKLEHTKKFTIPSHETSLPLKTTDYGLPSLSSVGEHQTQLSEAAAGLYSSDDGFRKTFAFADKNQQLSNLKDEPVQRAKDICGTIDNGLRFLRGKVIGSKFRRAAGDNAGDEIENKEYNESDLEANGDTDFHNDADEANDKKDDGAKLPLVITADISLPPSNEANMKTAIEHLPSITRGAWPWLAAIYVNNLTSLFYQCGGTLISPHIVISSAHCFATPEKQYIASELLVFLGRHNLNNWNEESSLSAPVDEIFVHPQFNINLNTYDADVAVLLLKDPVRFNTYIRPACLWSGDTETKNIHGEQGIVVGWGSTRAQSLFRNVVPRVVEAPIVSNDVCFKTDEKYSSLSSNRTFCAGIVSKNLAKPHNLKTKLNINGKHKLRQQQPQITGLCTGDSGAGLMILKNKRWILRGIVSASLPMSADTAATNGHPANSSAVSQTSVTRFACNVNQYVIYTDVAQFLDWIYALII